MGLFFVASLGDVLPRRPLILSLISASTALVLIMSFSQNYAMIMVFSLWRKNLLTNIMEINTIGLQSSFRDYYGVLHDYCPLSERYDGAFEAREDSGSNYEWSILRSFWYYCIYIFESYLATVGSPHFPFAEWSNCSMVRMESCVLVCFYCDGRRLEFIVYVPSQRT